MKILQLGKFYPIGGGVEKVMLDLTAGMSERGADCDMMCASADGGGYSYSASQRPRRADMLQKYRQICFYDDLAGHAPGSEGQVRQI